MSVDDRRLPFIPWRVSYVASAVRVWVTMRGAKILFLISSSFSSSSASIPLIRRLYLSLPSIWNEAHIEEV